ncbi:MAG TPA: prepilin-type N-terminal cleavage/methylation domain-containing protein [Gammaproteobacteria bacterium]|jgi:prepilin-type N-terminal cleavage/methylation domain-containing protein
MKRQAGFTLVEIAIVLVVIGLLLGGVLKGQELILNSQVRNVVNEFNNVAAAKYTYQDRYRQIPGDDNTADARWSSADGTTHVVVDGDGSSAIEGAWNATAPVAGTTEAGIFWHHLRNDGLVYGPRHGSPSNGPTYQLPRNAFDGLIGVQETAFTGTLPGPVICQSGIPGKAAVIIDTRVDDDPGNGSASDTGILQGVAGEDPSVAAAADYTVDDTAFIICREM